MQEWDDERSYAQEEVLMRFIDIKGNGHDMLIMGCFACGRRADPRSSNVSISRISGDSRNGYESYHTACADAYWNIQKQLDELGIELNSRFYDQDAE